MNLNNEVENKILETATDVFIEKGKSGAKMQYIADRAGINKALLHYYFRSKDRLYKSVFQNVFKYFIKSFYQSIDESTNFKTLLRNFINNYIDKVASKPKLLNFVMWEIQNEGAMLMEEILRQNIDNMGSVKDILTEKLKLAIKKGEVIDIEPIHIYSSVIGLCAFPYYASPLLSRIFPETPILNNEFKEKRKEYVFRIVWEGIKGE